MVDEHRRRVVDDHRSVEVTAVQPAVVEIHQGELPVLEQVRRVERLGVQAVEFVDGSLEVLGVEQDDAVDEAVARSVG